jgi:hypothetical protein
LKELKSDTKPKIEVSVDMMRMDTSISAAHDKVVITSKEGK